ncbi:MAG: amidohydrolase family protein [Myxococcota bacterium]
MGGCLALLGGLAAGGDRLDLVLADGLIEEAGVFGREHPAHECDEVVDVSGQWLAPAFIDSHVHLAYLPAAESLAAGGVAAAVDLAAPIEFLEDLPPSPLILAAGPMITAVGGYPTQSWGSGGYGIECADADDALAAVDLVHERGARVVKIPFGAGPPLPADAIAAAIARAGELGLPVVGHALGDASAMQAAAAGVEVLAHTPVEPLEVDTIAAWSSGVVISTLDAFGGSASARSNLTALRDAGTTVLYGTDLGNSQDAGIQAAELLALQEAGMDGAAILAAGTSAPASYWGLDELGSLDPGKRASVLVLSADPIEEPLVLSEPDMVYLDGVRVDGGS